jgi:CDGSH-type Zn-finger protein
MRGGDTMATCRCGNTKNAEGNCDGSHANIQNKDKK